MYLLHLSDRDIPAAGADVDDGDERMKKSSGNMKVVEAMVSILMARTVGIVETASRFNKKTSCVKDWGSQQCLRHALMNSVRHLLTCFMMNRHLLQFGFLIITSI